MSRELKYAVSLAALFAAAPLALAQPAPGERGPGSPAEQGIPQGDSPAARGAPEVERGGQPDNARNKDQKVDERGAGSDRKEKASDDRPRKDSGRDERAKSEEKQQNNKTGDKKDDRASDRKEARDADRKRERDRKASEGEQRDRASEEARDDDKASQGRERGDQASGEVSEESRQKAEAVRSKVRDDERERVRDVAVRGNVRRADDIDIRIRVGVTLPRRVAIYDLPPDIIEIVPAYRGYHYVVVGNDYCIVDPQTYLVVDVIPIGGSRAEYAYRSDGGSARLSLTDKDIAVIRRGVRDRGRNFDFDGDLKIGVALPGDFALEPFPEFVVEEVPAVKDHRFVHVEDDIVIVAPDETEVLYVIDE